MGHAPNEDLTPRELEVLELVKLRRTNKEIAEELVIEESTVETHVRHVVQARLSDAPGALEGDGHRLS